MNSSPTRFDHDALALVWLSGIRRIRPLREEFLSARPLPGSVVLLLKGEAPEVLKRYLRKNDNSEQLTTTPVALCRH